MSEVSDYDKAPKRRGPAQLLKLDNIERCKHHPWNPESRIIKNRNKNCFCMQCVAEKALIDNIFPGDETEDE